MVLTPDRIASATAVPLADPDEEQPIILRAAENIRAGTRPWREQNKHVGATQAVVAETVMHATWLEDN
jgi:hypothetical protein